MVKIVFYQEKDGRCALKEFLDRQSMRAQAQARDRIALLRDRGHTLRRPHAENLGQGLYELRWHTGRVQYRILYFFHGQGAVVCAHGLTKEGAIAPADLERTLRRKQLYLKNPQTHTYGENYA